MSPLRRFGQGPSYSPNRLVSQSAPHQERSVQGRRRAKHKTYIVLSMINGSYCRRRRRLTIFEPDEIRCVFDPPYFVNYITVEDRVRDSFRHIFLERNITIFQQKFGVWSKELSKCFSKLVISITLCQQLWSNLEICRMEIQNASTASRKYNQLRNVNTVRWESGNVTTQPWEINNRKSEVIAFVVNAGMNVTANNFYI